MASTIISPYIPSVMIYGPVKSGKSSELINTYNSLVGSGINKRYVKVFKNKKDDIENGKYISNGKNNLESILVSSSEEIANNIDEKTKYVFISGINFFEDSIDILVENLLRKDRKVIMSGINLDYELNPYNKMPELMALSRSLVQKHGVCYKCSNKKANHSLKVNSEYEPSCFRHHNYNYNGYVGHMNKSESFLKLFLGPMFSSKTESLLEVISQLNRVNQLRGKYNKEEYSLFKWSKDKRFSENTDVISHNKNSCDAFEVNDANEILKYVESNPNKKHLLVDEGQFMKNLEPVVKSLYDKGHFIYVSGLPRDFRGEPFGKDIPKLMTIADEIDMRVAYCDNQLNNQHCGIPATESQRIIKRNGKDISASYDDPVVLVGEKDLYIPRCFNHHEVLNKPELKYNIPNLKN
ncbi:MAG: hypothetical protein ACOCP4_00395 [Candidatus Woesearchaeota archaeon]